MAFFDLEKHYCFYGSCHNDIRNKIVHFLFVWPLFFSTLLLLDYFPPFFPSPFSSLDFPGRQYIVINVSFFVALFHAIFYILVDFKVGVLATCLIYICLISAEALFQTLGGNWVWLVGVAIQLISRFSQLIGHVIFEKRVPELSNDLLPELFMAPFFVLIDVLEIVFGFEPYSGFRNRVKANVDEDIREFRAKKEMLLSQNEVDINFNF